MARIVVVEDEAELAAAIAARLRSEGHAVAVAGDGPAAVELVAAERPDAVVLDLMLPGFDGLEVCRRAAAAGKPGGQPLRCDHAVGP
jgi:DNA-binding response OmpR family regulator